METRKNPTIPMVPKVHLKNVEHQRDQYKAERDTLIDDIAVLRANNKRLERENEKYRNRAENAMELAERTNCGVLRLKRENDDYHLKMTEADDKIKKMECEVKQQDSVIGQFVHDLQYAEWEIIPHLEQENEQLKRKAQAYDKMMTGEIGELYKKAKAFDEVLAIHNMDEEYEVTIGDYEQYIDKLVKNYLEDE